MSVMPEARAAAADPVLVSKRALEGAMRSEPENAELRALYFQQLARVARSYIGLCTASLPELQFSLLFRCGTSDVDALTQVFLHHAFDFPLKGAAPARILDLSAGVGYATVFLANRFPDAQILCLEPVPANFRLLLLNTMAYRNTAHLNAAGWSHSGRLRVTAIRGTHRDYQFAEAAEGDQGTYRCLSVAEILRMRAWSRVEFVSCDMRDGGAALFAEPAEWIDRADVVAVRTHKEAVLDEDSVSASFDRVQFTHARHGDIDVYQRHPMEPPVARPRLVSLIHSGPGLAPMEVRHAPTDGWGFFLFDDRACQSHPAAPGEAPTQVVFRVDCTGQSRFTTVVLHAGQPAEDVIFHVVIRRLTDGAVLMDSARRVLAGAGAEWSERIPVLIGRHEVVLETEMAPGTSTNANAWARWIDPRLG
jgi:FkbM family methyltransferase